MQCFENFGGANTPNAHPWLRACIQSYKIAFVARVCNIQCIFHQSCPVKTRNFTPMRNPVI